MGPTVVTLTCTCIASIIVLIPPQLHFIDEFKGASIPVILMNKGHSNYSSVIDDLTLTRGPETLCGIFVHT